jgi:hypothetical protein
MTQNRQESKVFELFDRAIIGVGLMAKQKLDNGERYGPEVDLLIFFAQFLMRLPEPVRQIVDMRGGRNSC